MYYRIESRRVSCGGPLNYAQKAGKALTPAAHRGGSPGRRLVDAVAA